LTGAPGVAREAERILGPLGHALDWNAFADAWREEYQPGMEDVRSGKMPFSKLDVLHRRNLERILPRLSSSRCRRRPCASSPSRGTGCRPGRRLRRLRERYRLAPVSNGNISLMADLARKNGLVWDAILGAEVAGDYKPKPRVYLAAAEAFDLLPSAA
jgi:2-haloacid dehalogenase